MNNHFIILLVLFVPFCYSDSKEEQTKAFYHLLPSVNFTLADGQKHDVIYTLFTDSSDSKGTVVTTENADEKIKNKTIPTILLIHGFTTDDTSPWYRPLRDEFFKLSPHNIIFINWNKASNKTWLVSAANVKPIGKYLAEFLIASKVELNKIHIIGHSLGSQLAAHIGKSMIELTGQKVGRITGLDAAGPSFSNPRTPETEKLNPNDAVFVDNIHTDALLYGYAAPIGHVDFYPNGGGHQPGCPSRKEDDNCSHARSTLYFIESLSTKIHAIEADYNEATFSINVTPKKDSPNKVIFGQHINFNARGVYYFKTNDIKPFLTE